MNLVSYMPLALNHPPAVNPARTVGTYWPPYPSRSRDHGRSGSSCRNGDCTWPGRFAWCDDRCQCRGSYVSGWFPSLGWPRLEPPRRYPAAWTATLRYDSTARFCKCDPDWCPHSTQCIPDWGCQCEFWNQDVLIGNLELNLYFNSVLRDWFILRAFF